MGEGARLKPGYYTIGHSTHTVEHFIALLKGAGVRAVVDVRTMPRSRTNPQFNADALPGALAAAGIGYEHIPALGGLRSRRREVPPEVNAFWQNASFHNYADYAMSERFAEGLARLRELTCCRCAPIRASASQATARRSLPNCTTCSTRAPARAASEP